MRHLKLSKAFSLIVMLISLGILIADYNDAFKSKDREEFYKLLTISGMHKLTHPAAQEFIDDFPPPDNYKSFQIQSKMITRTGTTKMGSIYYLNKENNNTHLVANFNAVRQWTQKTNYRFYAMLLFSVSLIIAFIIFFLELREKRDAD